MPLFLRLRKSFTAAFTKIFFGGCCWQIMGLLSDRVFHDGGQHVTPPFNTTLSFTLLTGVGDALGVCLGHALLTYLEVHFLKDPFQGWSNFWKVAATLATGSLLSGGAWQGLADGCIDLAINFNLALLLVAFGCGSFFFLGMTTGRALFNLPRATCHDFTLSIACGFGSGVFVGTDRRYPNNWLQAAVGERTGDAALDIFKAGLSVFIGFVLAQTFLSLFLRPGWLWTDAEVVDVPETVQGKREVDGSDSGDVDVDVEENGKDPLLIKGSKGRLYT